MSLLFIVSLQPHSSNIRYSKKSNFWILSRSSRIAFIPMVFQLILSLNYLICSELCIISRSVIISSSLSILEQIFRSSKLSRFSCSNALPSCNTFSLEIVLNSKSRDNLARFLQSPTIATTYSNSYQLMNVVPKSKVSSYNCFRFWR